MRRRIGVFLHLEGAGVTDPPPIAGPRLECMKLRGIDILRDVDLAAIAFLALSANSRQDAPRTGPVPSADDSIPSSEPSTPTGDTAPADE
jgi:hypothetical protein